MSHGAAQNSFPLELLQMGRAANAGIKPLANSGSAPSLWPVPGELDAFPPPSPRFFLTVRVALAELLAEILSHDARAGAVTGVLGVVTRLVVVHLGRRII